MFSQVSVCPGGDLSHPSGQKLPWADTTLADTPWVDTPLADNLIPQQKSLPTERMLAYGQQAGGTHPTGMHSCLVLLSTEMSD